VNRSRSPEETAAALVKAGDVDGAAELLANADQFAPAAQLLLDALGIGANVAVDLAMLAAPDRRRAQHAAQYLVRAGKSAEAAEIYEGLGEREKAARLYVRAGDTARALAVRNGSAPNTTTPKSTAKTRPLDAARACFERGDKAGAYEWLIGVANTDADYADACRVLVELVWPQRFLDVRLATFLGAWTSAVPTKHDLEPLCHLAVLSAENGRIDDARAIYRRIAEAFPRHKEALMGLSLLRDRDEHTAERSEQEATTRPHARARGPAFSSETSGVFARVKKSDVHLREASLDITRDEHAKGELAHRVSDMQKNAIIGGRYVLREKLGGGGMAVVFEAHDTELDEKVALKFLLPLDDAQALNRFKREIALSRRLAHENLVRVFDLGVHADLRYITMELLEGEDLAERMLRPIDIPTVLDVIEKTCRGLHAAHAQGVIHRDVKPANIFLVDGGGVKVMDFGIARAAGGDENLTQIGMVMGTPRYMAPEIFMGKKFGAASDLYAVGVTLYEALCGVPPFHDVAPMKLLMKHVNDAYAPARSLNRDIPLELDTLIARLLAKEPEQRPASAGAVADSLAAMRAWWTLNAPTRVDDPDDA
jgi:tetratricopeptide (TPR) repeat protein